MTDRPQSRIERAFFWLGTVLAVLVASFQVVEYVSKPAPAKLEIDFPLADNGEFRLVPRPRADDPEWTEFFPLSIVVRNRGGLTAEDAVLRIVHPKNFAVVSQFDDLDLTTQQFIQGSVPMLLTTIQLGDLHPGQEIRLDDRLLSFTEDTTRVPVDFVSQDGYPGLIEVELTVTIDVRIRLSGKDIAETERSLYVTVGPRNLLEKDSPSFFWETTDDGGLRRWVRPEGGMTEESE